MKHYRRIFLILCCLNILMICISTSLADEIYYNRYDGNILFNNIEWGADVDSVTKYITEKYNGVEFKTTTDIHEYGDMKVKNIFFDNSKEGSMIGKVGDMDVERIVISFLYEENNFDYSMYSAKYINFTDISAFTNMIEMLEFKYGKPYSYSSAESWGYTTETLLWKSLDEKQEVSISRMYGSGSLKDLMIVYTDAVIRDYMNMKIEQFNTKQKEEEIANKDYDGL